MPSYGDLQFCLKKATSKDVSEEDMILIKDIFFRSKIVNFDFERMPLEKDIEKKMFRLK